MAKPLVLCEDESVIGTMFYVMDCVEGRVLWDPALPGMTREERAAIWDEKNKVISRLHSIDYRAVGLEDFGKPGNYIGRQVERWSKQYRASETQRIEAMDNLIGWLPKNIPPEAGTTVVHGDFRLDNTIFHPDRAAHPGGARLGAVDARRSAGRLRLPLHGLPHPARQVQGDRRLAISRARNP